MDDNANKTNWEDTFNCTKEKKQKQYDDFDSFDSNWSSSFKEKLVQEEEELDPESQEYLDSLKDKI